MAQLTKCGVEKLKVKAVSVAQREIIAT